MTEWQPIETAPKDERPVLLWCVMGSSGWAQTGYYKAYTEEENGAPWEGWIESYDGQDLAAPSHWMPLPTPPEKPHE